MIRHQSIALALCVLAGAQQAHASEASGTSEVLRGWSEDGKTYAVEYTGEGHGASSLRVYTDGALVLSLCDPSENEEYDEQCVLGKVTKAIASEVDRVDVQKNKHLLQFKLRRVSSKWRKDFKKAFTNKGTHPGKDWNGRRCKRGWMILDRATKTEAAAHEKKNGCLNFKGGYLSPTGTHVLIKQNHTTSGGDEEDGFWTHDEIAYVLLPLKAVPAKALPAKAVPAKAVMTQ